MTITWNEDEGYDVSYHRIAERYGIGLPYDKATREAPKELQEMLAREAGARNVLEENRKKVEGYRNMIRSHESTMSGLTKDLELQEKHYQLEPRSEYKEKIERLKLSIENTRAELERMRRFVESAERPADFDFDLDRAASLAKFCSYFDPGYSLGTGVPRLPTRNSGTPIPFTPDLYSKVFGILLREVPDTVYLYDGKLFFREAEREYPNWDSLAQEGFEIREILPKMLHGSLCNGRLFLDYSADFLCEVTATAIREPLNFDRFEMGLAQQRGITIHPIFPELKVYPPRSVILFNETLLVRHDFRMKNVGTLAGLLRRRDDDDED